MPRDAKRYTPGRIFLTHPHTPFSVSGFLFGDECLQGTSLAMNFTGNQFSDECLQGTSLVMNVYSEQGGHQRVLP